MATKKQLEAKVKRLQAQMGKTPAVKSDILETAVEWIGNKLKAKVIKQTPNTYTTKDSVEHKGTLLNLDSGVTFQVGEQRFWKVK